MSPDEPWLLIPEFIALFVGTWVTWFLTFAYFLWNRRKSRRTKLAHLHENLQSIGLAWSSTEAALKPASSVDLALENRREQKWVLLAGLILSIASWLGFFILTVLILSLEYLARPRIERSLFESELTQKKLSSPDDVRKIVSAITGE